MTEHKGFFPRLLAKSSADERDEYSGDIPESTQR